jgi:hypothetical protein
MCTVREINFYTLFSKNLKYRNYANFKVSDPVENDPVCAKQMCPCACHECVWGVEAKIYSFLVSVIHGGE